MRIKTIILLALVLSGGSVGAQQELFLFGSDNIWSANALNPAFFPEGKKIAIGLPAYALDAAHSGDISYNDLLRKEGDRTVIDFSQLLDRLEPENKLRYDHRFETISLGLRLPAGLSVQVGHAIRFHTEVIYPESLPQLLWRGNGPFVGQTLDIAPQMQVFDFNELSIGAGFRIGRLHLGGRYKYLSGISALQSDEDHRSASVYTDDDIYQLTLNTDYGFHSASLISGIDTAGLSYDIKTEVKEGKLFSANKGKAFDLGVSIRVSDRLSLSASVLDLGGSINWNANSNYFRSNGTYTYDGVVFPGSDIINGADSLDFSSKLDTLNDIFQFVKMPETFSTSLPTRYYAGGILKISAKWDVGISVFHQTGEKSITAAGLSTRWKPLRWLVLGGMYTVNDRRVAQFGFQLGITPGPLQLYVMSDNLIGAFSPKGTPALNFRAGAGLAF